MMFDMDASVSVQASDPKSALEFPFSINNNSNILTILNIEWHVNMLHAKSKIKEATYNFGHNEFDTSTPTTIGPGRNLNVKLDILSSSSPFIITDEKRNITDAELELSLTYDISVFGLFNWRRHPEPTRFTWIGDATNPQWIRGAFAAPPTPRARF
jgi:hypothetical protein